jgi:hypothetical protein
VQNFGTRLFRSEFSPKQGTRLGESGYGADDESGYGLASDQIAYPLVVSARAGLRTVRTGQAACRTTFSATLPRMACEIKLRP